MERMAASVPIHLPVFQRFDCHSCTYCCRQPIVPVNEQDRRRIVAAGWPDRMAGQEIFVPGGAGRRQGYRLARREDGACIFLGDDNRCRLHAETGAETKPLACRLFPFVIVPGVGGVRLDLRMDCPSVAANKGRTLSVHAGLAGKLAAESGITRSLPGVPAWGAQRPITEREFAALVCAFESVLRPTGLPLRVRLAAGCHLLDLLYDARIDKVRDERFVELLELLANAAMEQAKESAGTDTGGARKIDGAPEPGAVRGQPLPARSGHLFRQWLFLHAILDDPEAVRSSGRLNRLAGHWRRYGQARRFAAGTGVVPRIRPHWPDTTFEAIDAVEPAGEEALEPVARALRLKLDAHAFAGPAYYGYDLLTGLTALWLLPAVIGWFARLAAIERGGHALSPDDVLTGVRQAHETFSVSPVFARVSERWRVRGLARPGVPAAILQRYGP